MKAKLLALALAVAATTAVAVGGVATAADAGAPSPDAQPSERTATNVGGYEFVTTDHDDWLADRNVDAAAFAERLLADGEVGDELRAAFDTDDTLAIDVYGSLQRDADAAHVVVTPAPGVDDSSAAEQEPRVEATVDLGDDTVELVGVSTPSDEEAVQLNASSAEATQWVSAEDTASGTFTVTTFDGEVRSAGDDGVLELGTDEHWLDVVFDAADAEGDE